jgi:hypothetical protein
MGIIIHRSRHTQQYVVVPNAIARNTRLSFRARGLLVMLLSLPPEWHVTTDQLAEDNPDSRTAVRAAMRELRESGYVEVHREQSDSLRRSSRTLANRRPVCRRLREVQDRSTELKYRKTARVPLRTIKVKIAPTAKIASAIPSPTKRVRG